MIGVIEAAALDAVEHLLEDGKQSLGTHLDVTHVAATPVGMRLAATAELIAVEGRQPTFRVRAEDAGDVVSHGTPSRMVVDVDRFDARLRGQAGQRGGPGSGGGQARRGTDSAQERPSAGEGERG